MVGCPRMNATLSRRHGHWSKMPLANTKKANYYFIFLSTSISAAHVALHQFYMFCSYFTRMVISSFAFSFAGFDRLQPFIHFL
jgi:hypothetical protein